MPLGFYAGMGRNRRSVGFAANRPARGSPTRHLEVPSSWAETQETPLSPDRLPQTA